MYTHVLNRTALMIAMLVCSLWYASSSAWAATCSNQSLSGDYGIQIEGTILAQNLTLRTLTLTHYDGQGKFTGKDHVVLGGNPPEEEWRPSSGTYSVNEDCTGSASVDVAPGNPPLTYHFIVVKNGSEILLVVDGAAIRGTGQKVDDTAANSQ